MSKAFDKLDHTKLLGRLQQYGISSKIHDWFRSYLQGSKQQVTVLGATFQELPVTSGVPQGSLVGAILFLLFVDDLPNTVKTSRVACYADDTKIFKSIDSITNCNALQSDLNNLVSWSESCGFISNQSKCKYQCMSRKKITCTVHPQYQQNAFGILWYRKKPLVCECQAILPWRSKDRTVCAEHTSKAPKRVVHFIFLSSGAMWLCNPSMVATVDWLTK